MPIRFGLLGAGGFAREVMPYVRESVSKSLACHPSDINVYFVETWEPKKNKVNGYPLISLESFLRLSGRLFYNVAVGDGKTRDTMAQLVGDGAQALEIKAPQSISLDSNIIGEGSVLLVQML